MISNSSNLKPCNSMDNIGISSSKVDEDIKNQKALNASQLVSIPDGGWGWVIVASVFVISLCTDGISGSVGLIHERLTEYFKTTQSNTSLIGSVFFATPLMAGPFLAAFVDKFGCRKASIIAGLISAVGFLLASISNSIGLLCVNFSFISGLGIGILHIAGVVSITHWFERKRTFAMSLTSCGIGLGTFIFLPVTQYLIEAYDWRNTLIIQACCLLNLCVCGALMRTTKCVGSNQNCHVSITKPISTKNNVRDELQSFLVKECNTNKLELTYTTDNEYDSMDASKQFDCCHRSLLFGKQNAQDNQECCTGVNINSKNANLKYYSGSLSHAQCEFNANCKCSSKDILNKNQNIYLNTEPESLKLKILNVAHGNTGNNKKSCNDRRFFERSINTSIPTEFKCLLNSKQRQINLSVPNLHKERNLITPSNPQLDNKSKWFSYFWNIYSSTFDFTIYTELHFLMINISSFIFSIWVILPFFFLKSYMMSLDMDGGPFMIGVVGIACTTGNLAFGWSGTQPWINIPKTFAVCLVICGVALGAYPLFITTNWAMWIISITYGFTFASYLPFIPAIILETIPREKFTLAYGMFFLVQGIAHLVGPPIAGLMYDLTGAWDLTFYSGGLWMIVAGLCIGVIPYTKNVRLYGNAPLLKDLEEMKHIRKTTEV